MVSEISIKVGNKGFKLLLADIISLAMNMSKSEAKRLIKQGAVEVYTNGKSTKKEESQRK